MAPDEQADAFADAAVIPLSMGSAALLRTYVLKTADKCSYIIELLILKLKPTALSLTNIHLLYGSKIAEER